MAFIRYRNLKTDSNGRILSGSGTLLESRYDKDGRYKSKQVTREALGRVVWLADDKKTGIFLSSTRGLIEYSLETDSFSEVLSTDERLKGSDFSGSPTRHATFGDAYWMLMVLEKLHLGGMLRQAFPDNQFYQRLLCHVLHAILRNGAKVSCDTFVSNSFLANLMPHLDCSTLRTDSSFFLKMGQDENKMAFFKAFIEEKKKENPSFGKCCCVDSTPLPNEAENNPFHCTAGTESAVLQSRLVLFLDEETGLPIWYTVIPGNMLDHSTLQAVIRNVESALGVTVSSMTLDGNYVSKRLIEKIHVGVEKQTLVAKMPANREYPYIDIYINEVKPSIAKGKYQFTYKNHLYFGIRKKIKIFDYEMFAYVYVDFDNAVSGAKQYMQENTQDFSNLSDSEKDWLWVRYGYFVLLSNIEYTPEEILSSYYRKIGIENIFKSGEEYLELLPLSEWTREKICGKIFVDTISTITILQVLKIIVPTKYDIIDIIEMLKLLMCYVNYHGDIIVDTANKKIKKIYGFLDILPPAAINLEKMRQELGIVI